jgi:hypothetical protein
MIGYHYTTAEAWETIKRDGLKPYPLQQPRITEFLDIDQGIWCWPEPQTGLTGLGQALWAMTKHRTSSLVVIRARFKESDILTQTGQVLLDNGVKSVTTAGHRGTFTLLNGEQWEWHADQPFIIVRNPIPAKHLTLYSKITLAEERQAEPFRWFRLSTPPA